MVRAVLLLAWLAWLNGPVLALDYPVRSVKIIIPFSPGGSPDVLIRLVGQKLSERWKQGVIIENRPGGNTMTGTVAAAKSDPDGYTLLCVGDQTFTFNPLLYSTLPYSMKELEPIILMASIPHMLAVKSDLPVSDVTGLVALAKRSPDALTYGSTGPGSVQRLATELFMNITGTKFIHVPFRGANETTTAILSGQIDMTINGMSNILPHMESGKLKVLAISTPARSRLAPNIPTMQEAGVTGYTSAGMFALYAPAGTAPAIRDKVRADVSDILKEPDVVGALERQSFVIDNLGPAEFDKVVARESEKWGEVIRRANIKGD